MKQIIKLLFAFSLLGLVISSCKQNDNQKKIIGKWKGTYNLTCKDTSLKSSFLVEYNFDDKGKCLVQDTRGDQITQGVMGYKIKGDSITFIDDNDPINPSSTKLIEFLSPDKLIITGDGIDCKSTSTFDKVNK